MTLWHDVVVWALAIGLPATVSLEMWRLRVRKEYPIVFWFCVTTTLTSSLLLSVVSYPKIYYYAYWGVYLIGDFFALAVMLEIFRGIFRPYDALRRLGTVMFRWTVAVLVLVSIASFASNLHLNRGGAVWSAMTVFDHSLQVLQCGIVLFMMLSSGYLGIPYRHRVFGIALGVGIASSINLIAVSLYHSVPANWMGVLNFLMMVSAQIAFVVWLIYLYIPQPQRRISEVAPESRRWEYALAGMQAPSSDSLFLSNIDRTVERLLAKNNITPAGKRKDGEQWFGD